ncbi:hypothetical protein J416_05133 [Gracilibacillus halophilus YIM-C55.5]|uniref:Metal ion ABC transporter membrane-spanning subunit n=1 Tax=Gracilibacillus halophilus YIM-C55.5 TaxID=1308866 RepID=N4WWB3_9BACI|nr:hypothetical protein J416_05133 [Gracilibacillus halophilus YIM-C55.5]
MAALCVIGRIGFQFMPNIQPMTAIIICSGVLLGSFVAMSVALIATYVSNLLLGMGIWTVWQIVAWGIIGVLSGQFRRFESTPSLLWLITFGIFCGYLYGIIVNIGTWMYTGKYFVYYLTSLPFDSLHAIGNVLFLVFLYPVMSRYVYQ